MSKRFAPSNSWFVSSCQSLTSNYWADVKFGALSVAGEYGAFHAAQSCDVGSPGWTPWTPPQITSIRQDALGVTLTWKAQPGSTSEVQYRPNACEGPWTTLVSLNIKQWVQALTLYGADYQEIPREGLRRFIPGTVQQDNWAAVCHPSNQDVWYNALPPYLNEMPARAYGRGDAGLTVPDFYRHKLWHCPETKFPRGVAADNDVYFSTVLNSKLIQPTNLTLRFSAVWFPADTVAFLESRASRSELKVDENQTDGQVGQPAAFASRFAPRHEGRGHLGFFDNRVEPMQGDRVVEKRPNHSRGVAIWPDGEILWDPNPSINPNWGSE